MAIGKNAICLSLIAIAIIGAGILCLLPSENGDRAVQTDVDAADDVLNPLSDANYKVYIQSDKEDLVRTVEILLPDAVLTNDLNSDLDLIIVQSEEELGPELSKDIADKIYNDVPVIVMGAAIDSLDSELTGPVSVTTESPLSKSYALIEGMVCKHTMIDGCPLETAAECSIRWAIGADSCISLEEYAEFISHFSEGI
jgi:hypothetical protein